MIATGSVPALAPIEGAGRCLRYSTIDDATRLGDAVKDVTLVPGCRFAQRFGRPPSSPPLPAPPCRLPASFSRTAPA
ncbi:hypothetical protein [Arthrobacter sp. UYEF3]|uniref:hypothetical protein n=1 Tax=Arthrobacter sp. UYEF3 TaxID=1756365 RepID=UPI003398A5A2